MKPFDEYDQDELRHAMAADHKRDCEAIAQLGIIPPWQDSDIILQADEARLLSIIADEMGVRYDNDLVRKMGLTVNAKHQGPDLLSESGVELSLNNAKAIINRCKQKGWITYSVPEKNVRIIDLTEDGANILWQWEQDQEF